jgi:hypothetical protein
MTSVTTNSAVPPIALLWDHRPNSYHQVQQVADPTDGFEDLPPTGLAGRSRLHLLFAATYVTFFHRIVSVASSSNNSRRRLS